MGAEAECRVWWNQQTSIGKALLETRELLFRGTFRLKIPFDAITTLEARNGQLQVSWPEGPAVFELGSAAEKWMEKIRNPKSLIDKLGVKPGMAVAVDGVEDAEFRRQLSERTTEVSEGKPAARTELFFYGIDGQRRLEGITKALQALREGVAVWTVYPKGVKTVTESDVRTALRGLGWKDTKVAAFSATHTALRWNR